MPDEHRVGFQVPSRRGILARLARVSKRFVDIARQHLYDGPLCPPCAPSWEAAKSFVEGIGLNGRARGKEIRSLEGLATWHDVLLKLPGVKLPYQARGCTPAFSWYLQVLRMCPRVEVVELIFETTAQVAKVVKALEPTVGTSLAVVLFVDCEANHLLPFVLNRIRPPPSYELLYLALTELWSVTNVILDGVLFPPAGTSVEVLPFDLFSLTVGGHQRGQAPTLDRCWEIMPADSTELEILTLETSSTYPEDSLTTILSDLSPLIKKICIHFEGSCCPVELDQYPFAPGNFSFPIDTFSTFENLDVLSLRNFVGPSIALLAQLSSSCPLLITIDFQGSHWIPKNSSITPSRTDTYYASLCPVTAVFAELANLKQLRNVHLGYYPTTSSKECDRIMSSMRERGIMCLVERCRSSGEGCYRCEWMYDSD